MKLTPLALKVLQAVADMPDGSCGCRLIATAMGLKISGRSKYRVAGGYAARLEWAGWLGKVTDWYTNSHGDQSYCGVTYWITDKGKEAIHGIR